MNSRSTSAGQSNASSTPNTTSELRPRNRRLISTELLGAENKQNAAIRERERERGISPIPSAHLSRTGTAVGSNSGYTAQSAQANGKGKGLWESGWTGSWSALQGLASSVLGGDVGDQGAASRTGSQAGRLATKAKKEIPATWGPSGSLPVPRKDRIAAGSLEERDRAVKAMRTASVLESNESVNGGLDVRGQHKRRTSMDETVPEEQDEEAMVYVHPVQPNDTVTGVVLKYNCQPAAFRKANRLWPSDPIQFRKVVLLPVDACAVRGKPCNPPEEGKGVDLLAPTPSAEDPPSSYGGFANGGSWDTTRDGTAAPSPFDLLPHQESAKTEEDQQPWTHVRWVLIDSSPNAKPISISRIRRKDLGYFPPRRRKSHTTLSTVSTPRGSFDHPLSQVQTAAPASPSGSVRRSSNLGARPAVASYFPNITSDASSTQPYISHTAPTIRPRANSRQSSLSISDTTPLSAWMRGPGGVGTLGKNVRKPGPAQDGLNSWAHKTFPGVTIDDLPSRSIAGGESVHWGIDRIDEEGRPSFASPSNIDERPDSRERAQGRGLENLASGLEGWVRRLAVRRPGTPKGASSSLSSSSGAAAAALSCLGEGDLIELLDGTGSDDGRGFEPSAEALAAVQAGVVAGGSGRDDLLGSLRGRSGKGGKSE